MGEKLGLVKNRSLTKNKLVMKEALEENKKIIAGALLVSVVGAVVATQTGMIESVTGNDHSGDAMEAGDAMQAQGDAMRAQEDAMESDGSMNSNDSMDSEGDSMDSEDSMNDSMEQ